MWNVRLARRQVRQFSGFQNAAVVPFVDVGTAGGLHYLAWPLVEGQTLDNVLQQHGKLPPGHAAAVAAQVAQGLAVAHQNNLFHGLLKPSNVMIGADGQARILDFGIGSLLVENEGESLVDTMSTANTLTSGLDYASPECIMEPSNRTPAGDQYSLGCLLYCTLAGHPPFPDGSAVEKMMAHQTKEPTSVKTFAPDAPDGLVAVVEKLMAKKPEDRYGGCDQVVEALAPFMAKSPFQTAGVGGRASSHRMAGLAGPTSKSSFRGAVETTPAPQPGLSRIAAQHVETPSPSSQPTGSNVPRPTGLPNRHSFQPAAPKESRLLLLTPATPSPVAAKLPTPQPAPATTPAPADSDRWIPGNDAPQEQSFGTLGVVATTLLITLLVYFGVLKLLQQ
jgi:serine/threonine-protein kinase